MLFLIPLGMEAAAALMMLWVRFGPEIMEIVTEMPGPAAVERQVAVRGATLTETYAARVALERTHLTNEAWHDFQAWKRDFAPRLGGNYLSEAITLCKRYGTTEQMRRGFRQFYDSEMRRRVAELARRSGRDITHQIPKGLSPMGPKVPVPSVVAHLLQKHGLVPQKVGEVWELTKNGTHVMYVPANFWQGGGRKLIDFIEAQGYT